jgi:hypothetical protein
MQLDVVWQKDTGTGILEESVPPFSDLIKDGGSRFLTHISIFPSDYKVSALKMNWQ